MLLVPRRNLGGSRDYSIYLIVAVAWRILGFYFPDPSKDLGPINPKLTVGCWGREDLMLSQITFFLPPPQALNP